ncbi:Threonine/homoserine efflux transporter RhtA [Clostridium cavendishii DSM 21758]|uniref:Threonine/homoserine efflux transporter RhtA n=1 Tax=Clostridium cavendishii DSM 21758 TaxID=1121302 RepID=A0A1M6G890_9CLOT|nr:DMT family transporter [Clostridium cavendishii]SHJ06193.1 Threonine/homoserine efflux transporter RhtA [Clostridium cavendishii DSM 21758]
MKKFITNHRKKAIIYLITASILWSTGGLFIKLVDWNPIAIAGARSGIATLVMLIYLKKPIKKLEKTKLFGACSYTALLICFVTANKLTTSANAILLQFTAPVWILLFSRLFLNEKIKKYDLITILIVMLGMLLFFIGDLKSGNMLGNFIAILSGIAMATFIIFLKLNAEDSPIQITLIGNILTFTIAIPFFFLSVPNIKSVIGLLILGIFQLGISYIFYTSAIKYVSTVEAILIPILEPLLNPIWVFLFTGETPSYWAFLGGTIVITSIVVRDFYTQKKLIK